MNDLQQKPQVLAKQRDVKVFKEFVDSLPEAKQAQYRERFNALDSAQKEIAMQKAILAYGARENSRSNRPGADENLGFGNIVQKMEQPLPDRPNPFMNAAQQVMEVSPSGMRESNSLPFIQHPLKTAGAIGQTLMAPYQALESSVARQALRAQEGKGVMNNIQNLPKDVYEGFTGPQRTMGDVNYRAGLNRMTADAAGGVQGMTAMAPKAIPAAYDFVKGGGVQQAIKSLQSILKKPDPAKALMELEKKVQAGASLADELSYMADEARKTAGAMQGGYIDANATDAVDGNRLNDVISMAPKALQEAILDHPGITKSQKPYVVTDPTGIQITKMSEPTIDPTLKNSETIRGIIKGRIPSSKWNIKSVDESTSNAAKQGYDDIGKIMTEGRPELRDAMKQYGQVKNAQKQIAGRLETNTGMTKSKPILEMFGKNADNADVQAIAKLAEENPEILNTITKIKKMNSKIDRENAIKDLTKLVGPVGASAVLSALGINALNKK